MCLALYHDYNAKLSRADDTSCYWATGFIYVLPFRLAYFLSIHTPRHILTPLRSTSSIFSSNSYSPFPGTRSCWFLRTLACPRGRPRPPAPRGVGGPAEPAAATRPRPAATAASTATICPTRLAVSCWAVACVAGRVMG